MSIMFARLLLAASLLVLAATTASAQTHYDTTPIPGAPPGYQRVVFTPVIDIANGYAKSSCYTRPYCSRGFHDFLFVEPCVDGKPCGFGHYTKSWGSFAGCPNAVPCFADTLDLTIGTQYSFYGNWIIEKYDFSQAGGGACADIGCYFEELYATGTYPSNTPALPATWGALRLRYR
jgi:hypothetical protein